MKRSSYRQALGGHTLGGQRRFDLDDFFNRAGEHNLRRRIVIGNDYVGTTLGDCRTYLFNGFGNSSHCAGYCRRITHQFATAARHFNQTLRVNNARFMQRGNLAETMTSNTSRAHANCVQNIGQ